MNVLVPCAFILTGVHCSSNGGKVAGGVNSLTQFSSLTMEKLEVAFHGKPNPGNIVLPILYAIHFFFFTCRISIYGRLPWFALLEWVQRCCTELFHAFSLDQLNRRVTQMNRKTRSDHCSINCLFKVMGQEKCEYMGLFLRLVLDFPQVNNEVYRIIVSQNRKKNSGRPPTQHPHPHTPEHAHTNQTDKTYNWHCTRGMETLFIQSKNPVENKGVFSLTA